jgi:DNA-binding NtrC family response regulator
VFRIHLPPLRERLDDLPALVQHYLRRFGREMGRAVRDVSPEAMARLSAYAWPGNVRELQSVLRQALLQASGTVLLESFRPELGGRRTTPMPTPAPSTTDAARPAFDLAGFIRDRFAANAADVHADTHREVDRMLFTLALAHTQGNHRDAARLLGISRQTLRVKMRALGLYVAHSVESDDDEA